MGFVPLFVKKKKKRALVPRNVLRSCHSCHNPPINACTLRIELEAWPSHCLQGQGDGAPDSPCVLPFWHFPQVHSAVATLAFWSSHVADSLLTQGSALTVPFAWKGLPLGSYMSCSLASFSSLFTYYFPKGDFSELHG